MRFITYIFANLWGRPARSLLTLSGVAVAVAAVVSLTGIVRGFEKSLLDLYEQQGVDLIVHQAGRVQMTQSVLEQSFGDQLRKVDGVSAVYPSLLEVVSLGENDIAGVTIQGWQTDSVALQELNIAQGRMFNDEDQRPIVLGSRLAAVLNAKVGDSIELLDEQAFNVIGIFESFNVFESGSVVTRLRDLQELMLRENEVTMFAVVTNKSSEASSEEADAATLARVKESILKLQGGIEANPVRELAEKSSEIKMARGFAWVTSTIALLIGSIGMLNTLMMAVFERTREIAMLRALGWRRRRIVTAILGEAAVLCFAGAVLGTLLAALAIQSLSRLPAAGRVVSGDLSWDTIVKGFVIAMLLGLLGGLYPAWKAARLMPVEGLRHD